MDAIYVISPYWNNYTKVGHPAAGSADSPFRAENRAKSGMPDPDELMDRYSKIVGFDPRKEGNGKDWEVAKIFHLVRGGTISHGIQARTVTGQASSDFSHVYFENTRKSLDAAYRMMRALKDAEVDKPRL